METAPDNTGRFTGRIESYAYYRRGYAPESLSAIAEYFQVKNNAHMLDLGSGTGILTAQLLSQFRDALVIGVEPNQDMRDYALSSPMLKEHLQSPRLQIIDGTAEHTTLPDHSQDIVLAGAAFHWFDGPPTRKEILRTGNRSSSADGENGVPFVILTHGRIGEETVDPDFVDPRWGPGQHWRHFNDEIRGFYQKHGIDYTQRVQQVKLSHEYLKEFFGHENWKVWTGDGSRDVTLEELLGGLESHSSVPRKGTPEFDRVVEVVQGEFEKWQIDGKVRILRDRKVVYGYVR